jgi:hypothetical protein
MIRRSLRHLVTALVLLVAFASQGTWALASTTGGLSGYVLDADTSAPVAGAQVTANSPSQTAASTTDATGHFTFLTLSPDTYTVTANKNGYQSISVPGQVVFADTVQSVTVRLVKALKTIAHVAATGAGSLVKSGTTADVYSINATRQAATAALGGGGSLNQAYSAIATVPGAYVIPNQTGYYETINIRGGDYDQVGYEFDGVPVNRSFDNYGTSSANSLGNAEVQVYTGADPATSEGQGLSGYVNQVIKTGTFPGYAQASLGIGTPTFYHRAAVEVGGATPDRLFSYYAGISGSNQSYNYVNNQNGSEYQPWLGVVSNISAFAPGGNGGPNFPNGGLYAPQCELGSVACFGPAELAMGPIQYGAFSTIYARNAIVNFHVGIPHRNDAGRDDVQVLYDNESLSNQLYESGNDFASPQCGSNGGVNCAIFLYGPQLYGNTPSWGCPSAIGHTYGSSQLNTLTNCIVNYGQPNQVNPGTFSNPNTLPASNRDHSYNQTVIAKLQYTKNFGSTAFLRAYVYSFYSLWSLAGIYGFNDCNFSCTLSPDYELNTHTRGVSAQFQDQINAQNLVSLQGNYTTATVTRDNNTWYNQGGNQAAVVNAKAPYSGYCFAPTGGPVIDCNGGTVPLGPGFSVPPLTGSCAVPGHASLGNACTYMVAENGLNGTITPGLVPNFYGYSITDQFRPSDKWLFNLGLRLDTYNFAGGNTLVPPLGGGGPLARQFWFNAFNLDNCISTKTGFVTANPNPGGLCPAGSIAAYLQNTTNQNFTYNIWQPRVAGTYTVNPNSVIRFSYGRYTEAPNTAFEQYGKRQEDLADFIGGTFLEFGRNTPGYPIRPPTSINYDLSWEDHFKGTDWSFKVTPFLRQTQDQIQQFFLNVKQGFVSGLNSGSQRSEGVEFQMQKGDFSRDGISGLLSFAYTNSYIKYGPVNSYGSTVLGGVNAGISQYNAYTAACVKHPTNPNCGATSNGATANACYNATGTPVAPISIVGQTIKCPAGDIVNPYWFAAVQSIIDVHSQFPTYSTFPGATAFPGAYSAFGAPYVASLVLNYKHDKYAITPSFQFQGGTKYGYPLSSVGIDPAAGCSPIPGTGGRYDATTCHNVVNIPNPFTGGFDTLGAFTQPNEFLMNLQLTYDVSPRIQLVGTLANIVNYCYGGTKAPWTFNNDGNICSYGAADGLLNPVAPYGTPGANINPPGTKTGGYIIQPAQKFPYFPTFGPVLVSALNSATKTPFQFYITANLKL